MRVRVRSGARDAARGGEGRHPLPGGGLLSARGRSGRGPAAERPSQPLPDQGRGWLLQRQGRQRDTGERRLALPRPAARRRPGEGPRRLLSRQGDRGESVRAASTRTEERRGGKECVSTWRSGRGTVTKKKNKKNEK